MEIERLDSMTVEQLTAGYEDRDELGVTALSGRLDVRPPYQRAFIYEMDKQIAVVRSILAGYPLNSMYWALREDGGMEVMDGQQRTISIGRYVHGKFPSKTRTGTRGRSGTGGQRGGARSSTTS